MRINVIFVAIGCIAVTSCSHPAPVENPKQPEQTAQILQPEWVEVAESQDGPVYVNSSSILPYKEKGYVSAEISYTNDKKKNIGYVVAYGCTDRMRISLVPDGTVSPPAPVVSWLVDSRIFNYICFQKVSQAYNNFKHNSNLEVTTP